jgi:hypothetical protein
MTSRKAKASRMTDADDVMLQDKPTRIGRPSSYTFEVSEEICRQMAEGKGLRQICSHPDMPDRTTVLRWVEDNDSFRNRYARAREACMDWYQEEILRIAFDDSGDLIIDGDRVMSGHHVVQRARLKVDTVKWVMAKLAPKKYGDRPEDNAEKTVTWLVNTGVLRAGEEPVNPPEPPRQITYQKPVPPADLSDQAWSVLAELWELIARTIPSDSDRPPEEIFGVMRDALKAHFRD